MVSLKVIIATLLFVLITIDGSSKVNESIVWVNRKQNQFKVKNNTFINQNNFSSLN